MKNEKKDDGQNKGPETPSTESRRDFLKHLKDAGACALVTAVAGGGIMQSLFSMGMETPQAHAAWGLAPTVKRKFRYGMIIDTRRCIGCKACMVACKIENKTPPGISYTIVSSQALNRPDDKPTFTTKPCFHCEHPPCVDVCPVGATFKRNQDGIVVVDYDRCIGCRYCITACPYGARYFDFGENYSIGETPFGQMPSPEYKQFRNRDEGASPIGNVRKCTFCLHLQDEEGRYDKTTGRWPACATTCTGHAIHFGDFQDPGSEVSRLIRERQSVRLKEELGTESNVHYLL